jgi:GNAT superfamily N-acetyltransferase
MRISVGSVGNGAVKASLCAQIIAELPVWFGRPESNAHYVRNIVDREVLAGTIDGRSLGLFALEYHFAITCNIRWLGVSPSAHRGGVGRALVERAPDEARARGCRRLAVETMSPRANSPEYERTRLFNEAVGFVPFVEFESEPGDHMMWMLREL